MGKDVDISVKEATGSALREWAPDELERIAKTVVG